MAQEQRPPVFELHIRPMFRLLDREHMLTLIEPGFDLWELGKVWEMRNDILVRLRGEGSQNMPGLQVGGPWPAEWINLFERWTQNPTGNDIGHHQVLAQPDGPYQLQPFSGDKRRLQAKVIAPTGGCRAWVELDFITPGQRQYTLYLEPALPAQPPDASPLQARELFEKADATKLVIHDAAGTHALPLSQRRFSTRCRPSRTRAFSSADANAKMGSKEGAEPVPFHQSICDRRHSGAVTNSTAGMPRPCYTAGGRRQARGRIAARPGRTAAPAPNS